MTLLEECLESLGSEKYILSKEEKEIIDDKFYKLIPLTKWGRVNWDKFENKKRIYNLDDLNQIYKNKQFYIIWSDPTEPIIKCNINSIIKNIHDILPVSFDTWLLSIDEKEIIEFYHESEIYLGELN